MRHIGCADSGRCKSYNVIDMWSQQFAVESASVIDQYITTLFIKNLTDFNVITKIQTSQLRFSEIPFGTSASFCNVPKYRCLNYLNYFVEVRGACIPW